jgi:hypothetical protein
VKKNLVSQNRYRVETISADALVLKRFAVIEHVLDA